MIWTLMTSTRKNLKLVIERLNKQLTVEKSVSEISRLEEEITELRKLITFGTREEKKWSK
jgi:hypothetical protein